MAEPLDNPNSVSAEPTSDPANTKTSLLDAAERLLAQEGVHRASLRAITRAAGANVASVHYHFGSKEALVRAVLDRRLSPLNRRRLLLLDRVEAESDHPRVEAIVRAFVVPTLEMVQRERGGPAFARFVCRTFSEPDEGFRDIVLEQFRDIIARFTAAFLRALPDLPPEEFFWRFHFMVGAVVHTAGLGFLAQRLSEGLCDPDDLDGLTARLVRFLSAGLEAEAISAPGQASE